MTGCGIGMETNLKKNFPLKYLKIFIAIRIDFTQ